MHTRGNWIRPALRRTPLPLPSSRPTALSLELCASNARRSSRLSRNKSASQPTQNSQTEKRIPPVFERQTGFVTSQSNVPEDTIIKTPSYASGLLHSFHGLKKKQTRPIQGSSACGAVWSQTQDCVFIRTRIYHLNVRFFMFF